MAALTYQAAANADNTHTVTRSTDDAIGSAAAALIVDSTLSKYEVRQAVKALLRALGRDEVNGSAPADYPTSGTSTE